jgi:ADP-ribose pyrophosphatase YjhB (NUDIX family)
MHDIQRNIIDQLASTDAARFKDLRPHNVEANLYSYHLASLQRQGYIVKQDSRYLLSPLGLSYIDSLKSEPVTAVRTPRVLTMSVLLNEHNEVYLVPRHSQPYIATWNLPCGKVYAEDVTIAAAAMRNLTQSLMLRDGTISRVGEAVIRVTKENILVSSVFVHVFAGRIRSEDIATGSGGEWTSSVDRQHLRLSPAVSEIIDTIRSSQQLPFFEEYAVEL